jgi:transcriptional regulator, tetR family
VKFCFAGQSVDICMIFGVIIQPCCAKRLYLHTEKTACNKFKLHAKLRKNMSVAKTRQKLVDVARHLFAQNGLEATTMNMIAEASQKGRRTLYTYFKNKEEIYYAVILTELERLSDRMDEVAAMDIEPEQKVILLIYTHLNMIKEAVVRNGNLRAEFFRNIWMVEKVRKQFDAAEQDVFYNVLKEGRDNGKFIIEDVRLMADIIHYTLKGLEVPYIYGRLGNGMKEAISRPIVAGLVRRALGMGPLR